MADAPPLPGEPPPGVTSEVIWRLASRLFHDHYREPGCRRCAPEPGGAADARCANCRQPWPCSGRRLAELGLNRAVV
jgi:hypothetical protein